MMAIFQTRREKAQRQFTGVQVVLPMTIARRTRHYGGTDSLQDPRDFPRNRRRAFSVQSRPAIHPIPMTARVYQIRRSKRKFALPVFFVGVGGQRPAL
jgi:hypothetical protein